MPEGILTEFRLFNRILPVSQETILEIYAGVCYDVGNIQGGMDMGERLLTFLRKHWDMVIYLFFGGLTTLVNYAVYLPLYNVIKLPAAVCGAAAWFVSVVFAYLTNKPFVFQSRDWSTQTVLPELGRFIGCRLLSGGAETLILLLTVDECLHWDGNLMKLFTSVMVVVLNYIGSKILVFRKKSR